MNHQTTRPQTATEILKTAASTLGERGKQYDPAGKQERSMTAIVAAFNAIYPSNLLTVHMGWQFMSLVKMVRGATKPHADSALDQVAYAALAAECVAEQLHQPVPTDAQAMAAAFSKHKEPRLTPYQKEQPAEEPTKYYVVLSQPELYDAQKEFIMEQVLAGHKVQIMSDTTARKERLEEELETQRGKCISQSSRISELQTLVDNLRSLLAQATKEAPCAHNTDEPKAPRPEYVDPFDQYGDVKPAPVHRLVGGHDSARGSLAYPNGKPL